MTAPQPISDEALRVVAQFPQGCTNKDEVLRDLASALLALRRAARALLCHDDAQDKREGLEPCVEADHLRDLLPPP